MNLQGVHNFLVEMYKDKALPERNLRVLNFNVDEEISKYNIAHSSASTFIGVSIGGENDAVFAKFSEICRANNVNGISDRKLEEPTKKSKAIVEFANSLNSNSVNEYAQDLFKFALYECALSLDVNNKEAKVGVKKCMFSITETLRKKCELDNKSRGSHTNRDANKLGSKNENSNSEPDKDSSVKKDYFNDAKRRLSDSINVNRKLKIYSIALCTLSVLACVYICRNTNLIMKCTPSVVSDGLSKAFGLVR